MLFFFKWVTSDPTVALKLAVAGFGIAILPLWMGEESGRSANLP
jgi:DNA-binding transcriptional LysR family regulator